MDDPSAAMSRYSDAGRAIYVAHLHASRAGRALSGEEKTQLREEVLQAAEALVETCDLEAPSEAEIVAAMVSE